MLIDCIIGGICLAALFPWVKAAINKYYDIEQFELPVKSTCWQYAHLYFEEAGIDFYVKSLLPNNKFEFTCDIDRAYKFGYDKNFSEILMKLNLDYPLLTWYTYDVNKVKRYSNWRYFMMKYDAFCYDKLSKIVCYYKYKRV